jgi:hypothetical protein
MQEGEELQIRYLPVELYYATASSSCPEKKISYISFLSDSGWFRNPFFVKNNKYLFPVINCPE